MATFEKSKNVVTTRRHLKAICSPRAFAVNGQLVAANSIVEVGMFDAGELLARGLAVDATLAEVEAAGTNIIVAPSRSDQWKDAA